MADVVIKGGEVVVANAVIKTDVVIADGRITALQVDAPVHGSAEVVDARGHYVLPGAIDIHTHILWPYLHITTKDTFFAASRAAALGGTTMIIDWAVQKRDDPEAGPEGSLMAALRRRRAQIEGDTVLDYTLHSTLSVPEDSTLDAIPPILEEGIAILKVYMTYRKRGIMTDDGLLWDLLHRARDLGAIVSIHAENAAIHEYRERRFKARGQTTAVEWGSAKTAIVEAEAVHRAVFLAEKVGTPILIRHISTSAAIESIRQARQRGAAALAETCPQYLVLDESILRRPDGFRYVCSPPVRSPEDQAAVWRAIQDGTINVIGSDHVAFSTEEKRGDGKDIFSSPSGLPGVETLFPIMFSEGFMKGRVSLPCLAALTATNAARLYGFFPQKGVLLPGSDADIVVVNPSIRRRLRAQDLHMETDYIPYEGMELQGYPVHTFTRGRFVVKNGEFCGEKGSGQFVRCRLGGWRALDPRWQQK